MKMSEESTNIIKALIKVQSSLETIKKDKVNKFADGYKYATLDSILESLLPKLSENDIFMTQEPVSEVEVVTEYENGKEKEVERVKVGVITRLYHSSGESIEYEPLLMPLEKGQKMNMAQSTGSIITFAKRYSISAAFGISTGDDVDGVQIDEPNQQQPIKPILINGRQLTYLKKLAQGSAEITNSTPDVFLEKIAKMAGVDSIDMLETKDLSAAEHKLKEWKLSYEKKKMEQEAPKKQNDEINWGK